MKTIVSFLLVFCVVSCSQPQSQPQPAADFAPIEMSEEGPTIAHPHPTPPPAVMPAPQKEVSPAVVVPAMPENEGALAKPPVAPPAVSANAAPSPFGHPPQPTIPAMTTPPVSAFAAASAATNAQPEPLLPELSVNFHAAPIDLVLQTYADFVHRTLLRSPNVNAQTTITLVQQNALTKTELIEAMDAVLAMNNIAMVPIGDKFVKVVPLADAGGAGGKINEMNESMLPEFGPFETHVVQLKYTKPSEMVPILQQFTKTPAAVLPIEGSGMVVLRDTAENVRRMMEMIARLDTSVPAEIESEVIPIKYALASDIANALNSISGTGGGTTFGGSASGRTGSLGTSRTTGTGNGRGFGGNVGSGGYNNGGIGQQGSVGGLGGGAGGLGSAGGSASPSFTDRVKSLIQRADTGGKGEFQILGQTKIIADERMNALLVFASHDDMQRVKDIVKKLDVVLAQVLIEAIIMEVTLDNSRTIGVSAAQNPSGNHNVYVGGFNNGQSFFQFPGSSGDSNSFPGNVTGALPGNMFSYWANFGNNVQVALQAAESEGRVNVLSRPRIQTSHGVEADLFVGETIPYVDSTTAGAFGGTGVYNSYQQQQIGITLKVKPLINPDGLVVMDIYQEASEPGPASTAVNINGTAVPTINQRQASATVAVKDRDTIILGGMISTTQSKTKSGVPYLKDIPVLGNLFRSTANTEERVELIVLIRPTVLPTPEAAAAVAAAEQRRLPGVRRAEAEIHAEEAARLKQADQELKDISRTNSIDPNNPFD
ncbi:MAG TPA: secretin N-terminal domain-containing protein [Verrucomicrobiae bacterium]|jgi:general secretion pathway protein D|nr:secretin N-terminal domain-containing protein [Verrucomicrobiae bacterium]